MNANFVKFNNSVVAPIDLFFRLEIIIYYANNWPIWRINYLINKVGCSLKNVLSKSILGVRWIIQATSAVPTSNERYSALALERDTIINFFSDYFSRYKSTFILSKKSKLSVVSNVKKYYQQHLTLNHKSNKVFLFDILIKANYNQEHIELKHK